MHNRIEDCPVEALDLFIDLFPLDAERLGVCDELVRLFVNRDDVRLRGLRDVVDQPSIKEINTARAHAAISSAWRSGSGVWFADGWNYSPSIIFKEGFLASVLRLLTRAGLSVRCSADRRSALNRVVLTFRARVSASINSFAS